jgi:hypothetical protein
MYRSDYETAYELETDEDVLKDIKLKVKKVRLPYLVIAATCACVRPALIWLPHSPPPSSLS